MRYKALRAQCEFGCCGTYYVFDTRSRRVYEFNSSLSALENTRWLNEGRQQYHNFRWRVTTEAMRIQMGTEL